jgi:hypothetical protein
MQVGTYADGRALNYDEATRTFDVGGAPVTPEQVVGYDKAGQVTWASDSLRDWAYQRAGSAAAFPALAPKKRVPKALIIAGVILGALTLCCVASFFAATFSSSDKTATTQSSTGQTGTTSPAVVPSESVPAPEANPVPVPAPEPEPATPKWTVVAKLSGSGNKRGSSFHLGGGEARLTYKVTGKSMPICTIYIVEKGDSLKESGGFPEAMVTKAGSDSTMLAQGEGDYYLDVTAANCSWTVTIEELR